MYTTNNISGYSNEFQICNELNNKRVNELNPLYYDMIKKLFGWRIRSNPLIKAEIDFDKKKYDMIITIGRKRKLISIKMGMNNSVHVEGISSFIHFLIISHVRKDIIIEYLKFHYADGTTNGTGTNRMSALEYRESNQDKIDLINDALNNPYFLRRCINRFVLQGKNSSFKIDGIIHGTKNDFFFISRKDIINIIMSKYNLKSDGVHVGQLFIQPMTRCINRNPKYEKKRFCVQIKWYSLFDDIIEYKNFEVMNKIRRK